MLVVASGTPEVRQHQNGRIELHFYKSPCCLRLIIFNSKPSCVISRSEILHIKKYTIQMKFRDANIYTLNSLEGALWLSSVKTDLTLLTVTSPYAGGFNVLHTPSADRRGLRQGPRPRGTRCVNLVLSGLLVTLAGLRGLIVQRLRALFVWKVTSRLDADR